MLKKIIAAYKTHFDYGYTDLAKNVLEKYCTQISDKAMEVCEQSWQYGRELAYKWTLPAYLLMKIYENADANKKERLKTLVQRDQICAHALPFTMHTPLLDETLLQRMFMYAEDYVSTFGKPFPISAKMTDVPGHTSAIIKPLTERGVRFLHLGKNPASTQPDVPLLFWWEDTCGNRILTMYNSDYGSSVLPPRGWKYPVWLAMMHTGDNVGVQDIDFILENRKSVPEGVAFVTGTLNDFAEEILRCDLSDLPVICGELGDTWIHGAGSYPDGVSMFRRSLREFEDLEKFALKQGISFEKYSRPFYEQALNYCEHTFGISILKYLGYYRRYEKEIFERELLENPNYAFAEESWEEQRGYALSMREICDQAKCELHYESGVSDAQYFDFEVKKTQEGLEICLPSGEKYSLCYEYIVFGTDEIHKFMKDYLVRFVDWSISDFGRCNYPERQRERFVSRVETVTKTEKGYSAVLISHPKSVSDYGNFPSLQVELCLTKAGLKIDVQTEKKSATPLIEAGNLLIGLERGGKEFIVTQGGCEIDADRDIVKKANHNLWAIDSYARIDNTKLYSYDAPLISFGSNGICKFWKTTPRKRKAVFAVNLFNNHWGTNFPQWIRGAFRYAFLLQNNIIE